MNRQLHEMRTQPITLCTKIISVQNHERSTRRTVNRPTMLLAQPMCKTSRFQNEFFQRCVGAWNSLPNDVVDSPSVSCFKHKLETVDLSNYLSYRF